MTKEGGTRLDLALFLEFFPPFPPSVKEVKASRGKEKERVSGFRKDDDGVVDFVVVVAPMFA